MLTTSQILVDTAADEHDAQAFCMFVKIPTSTTVKNIEKRGKSTVSLCVDGRPKEPSLASPRLPAGLKASALYRFINILPGLGS